MFGLHNNMVFESLMRISFRLTRFLFLVSLVQLFLVDVEIPFLTATTRTFWISL